ncbi:MAG: FmdB family zinc ribbon protein [Candidatus Hydrogenedentes bacterium]|nr:FmdB family zinc ribbon protein [Candidatus Hydrogenedentota bacterium]
MPTYTYQCQKCDTPTLVYHSMSATPKVKCGACGSGRVKRMLGTGSGIIFKGSGFYETDYKTKTGSEAKGDSGAKSEGKSEGASEAKSESKSEAKPEAKPAPKSEAKTESKAAASEKPKSTKKD